MIRQLLTRYGFTENHVYLLELVPLIAMIWADGVGRRKEIDILQDFTVRHLADLSTQSDGVDVISVEEANDFIAVFTHQPPDPDLLDELKRLALDWLSQRGDSDKNLRILDYCMDIAAACAQQYPYKFNERIVSQEKALLRELIVALDMQDTQVSLC